MTGAGGGGVREEGSERKMHDLEDVGGQMADE